MRALYTILLLLFFSAPLYVLGSPQKVAESLAYELNARNVEGVYQLFDMKAYGNLVATQLFDDKKSINDFMQGFLQDEERLKGMTFRLFGDVNQNPTYTFVRIMDENGIEKPLVRMTYEAGGVDYVILELDEHHKIIDMFVASTGKMNTDSHAQLMQLSFNPSQSFMEKILGRNELNQEVFDIIVKMNEAIASGGFQASYEALLELPQAVLDTRVMVDIAILLSSRFDDAEYKKQLTRLATLFGDESDTQFMLIDHYIYNEQFDKAMNSINSMIARYGEDGPLFEMKTGVALMLNQPEDSIKFIQKAIEVEPSYESSYWVFIELLMMRQDYSEVLNTFDYLSLNFDYLFDKQSIMNEPFYQKLVESEAFAAWTPVGGG